MWQGVGAYSRGLGHVTRARGIWQGEGWGHVAGGVGMWQGVGSCGRVLGHVAGVGACDKAYPWAFGKWRGGDMWQGLGTCGRVWGQVAGFRGMW